MAQPRWWVAEGSAGSWGVWSRRVVVVGDRAQPPVEYLAAEFATQGEAEAFAQERIAEDVRIASKFVVVPHDLLVEVLEQMKGPVW